MIVDCCSTAAAAVADGVEPVAFHSSSYCLHSADNIDPRWAVREQYGQWASTEVPVDRIAVRGDCVVGRERRWVAVASTATVGSDALVVAAAVGASFAV